MAGEHADADLVTPFRSSGSRDKPMMSARIIGDLALIASIGYLLAVMLGAFG